jgi:tRNA-dihydrouridine synthase B
MDKMKPFPKLKNQAILSPMSGVTDVAFRALAKRYGATLTYTEFVSSAAIVRGNERSAKLVVTDCIEKPVAVQLFGSSVEEVVEAAKLVESKFDLIDINCGCPAWKVIKTGAGSALLNEPQKIAEFVKKLVEAVDIPITVKIRAGLNEKNINAVEIAKTVEKAGASGIAVHGRTTKQGYSGKSDWDIIKKVKESVDIFVIGNGDVFTPEDFKKRLEESGVDAIMIARGAIGNPYLFKQINDYMETGKYYSKNKVEQFFEYLELAKKYELTFAHIKTQAVSFTKGMEGGAFIRTELAKCKDLDDLERVMGDCYNSEN